MYAANIFWKDIQRILVTFRGQWGPHYTILLLFTFLTWAPALLPFP